MRQEAKPIRVRLENVFLWKLSCSVNLLRQIHQISGDPINDRVGMELIRYSPDTDLPPSSLNVKATIINYCCDEQLHTNMCAVATIQDIYESVLVIVHPNCIILETKLFLIPSISIILPQEWYYSVQYTTHHHVSLFLLCQQNSAIIGLLKHVIYSLIYPHLKQWWLAPKYIILYGVKKPTCGNWCVHAQN